MKDQAFKQEKLPSLSLKNSLYRKMASYELDLSADLKNDMFLYMDIFRSVKKPSVFRVRVRKQIVERLPPGCRKHRALLIEYAMVHEDLDSFEARSEEEALRRAVACVMRHGRPDIELAYSA